ncbi:MAG: methyltransferase domain-containing protein [bacterium]
MSDFQQALAAIEAAPRPPKPWRDGSQLPWNDAAFSERMLAVHLDQATNMASRTEDVIEQHVAWLHGMLQSAPTPAGSSSRVLDVGCGPGQYCHRLARMGYQVTGLDFAPAPLAHARYVSETEGLDCTFVEADLNNLPDDLPDQLAAQLGLVDAITFWFGEFHAFPPETAATILKRLAACLTPGGLFVLEYQPYDLFVQEESQEWKVVEHSVFSDRLHLWLEESNWDDDTQAEIVVHWIVDAQTSELSRYAQCHQAYRDDELVALCEEAGFTDPRFFPPITGVDERLEFPVLVMDRAAAGDE